MNKPNVVSSEEHNLPSPPTRLPYWLPVLQSKDQKKKCCKKHKEGKRCKNCPKR